MRLGLEGLEVRPAQVWGTVRLVPLVREVPLTDLRLAVRRYDPEQWLAVTGVSPKQAYLSYVPHGIVMRWSTSGEAEVPADTRLGAREVRQEGPVLWLKRTARREARDQLRLLPLHMAMEGFLALCFGGPEVAHRYYARRFRRRGLDPRVERFVRGQQLPGLDEALRVFEIHRGQCGVLVFVGDTLASAMVVGHPDDYRALHDALIEDFYGALLERFGWAYRRVPELGVQLEGTDLDAIAASLSAERAGWAAFWEEAASGLFGREVDATVVRKAGGYRLVRFATGYDERKVPLDGEHLGEALVGGDGRLAYLKTYRLDRGPVRRARILTDLAAHDWDLQALADAQGHGKPARVVGDLTAAGLDWIVTEEMRARARLGGVR